MENREAGVVILAAGRSARMKEMKPFLSYDDQTLFIEKIISTYFSWGCNEIIVVTNQEALNRMKQKNISSDKVKIVVNDHLELERFHSVRLGLGYIRTSSFCFIQNIDNPFISPQILDILYMSRSDNKFISPVFENKGGHPVLLNRGNIDRIINWPVNNAVFKEVLNSMECVKIEMKDNRVLININSPEEYHKFFDKIN